MTTIQAQQLQQQDHEWAQLVTGQVAGKVSSLVTGPKLSQGWRLTGKQLSQEWEMPGNGTAGKQSQEHANALNKQQHSHMPSKPDVGGWQQQGNGIQQHKQHHPDEWYLETCDPQQLQQNMLNWQQDFPQQQLPKPPPEWQLQLINKPLPPPPTQQQQQHINWQLPSAGGQHKEDYKDQFFDEGSIVGISSYC